MPFARCQRIAGQPRQRHTWGDWEPAEGAPGYERSCAACGRSQRRREALAPVVHLPAPAPVAAICGACGGSGWVEVNERGDVGRCHHDEAAPG